MIKKHYPLLLSILAGIFIGTSYIPFVPWAVLFAFTPLWYFWDQENISLRKIFFTGWVTQFVLTAIGFNWIAYTIHEFGHLTKPVAYLGLFAFCCFANIYIPLSGVIWAKLLQKFKLKRAKLASFILLASITALMESYFPQIFSWNFGYTLLWSQIPSYHFADVIGFQGLSGLIILSNAFVLYALKVRKEHKEITALFIIGVIIVQCVLIFAGKYQHQNLPRPDKSLKVLGVQANISNLEKVYAEQGSRYQSFVVDKFLNLTTEGQLNHQVNSPDPIDFALWPETAFPTTLGAGFDQNMSARKVKARLQTLQLPLITGSYSRFKPTNQSTNSMFFLNKDGAYAAEPYHKSHLLAFGEYFPLAQAFPSLPKMFPQVANFHAGNGPTVRDINGVKLGPQICYESLFPGFSGELSRLGAQVLVNITNDSWYGDSKEPDQHLYMTLARAIETRRPLIRGTNTGYTTGILADGTLLKKSPLFQEWAQVFDIPYSTNASLSIYTQFPWIFPCLLVFLCLINIVILKVDSKPNGDSFDSNKSSYKRQSYRDRLASRRPRN